MSDFEDFITSQLNIRAQNVLRAAAVSSFDDLEALTADDILRMPNAGRRTLSEIEAAMQKFGRVLADRPRIQSTEMEDARRHIKRVSAQIRKLSRDLEYLSRYLDNF